MQGGRLEKEGVGVEGGMHAYHVCDRSRAFPSTEGWVMLFCPNTVELRLYKYDHLRAWAVRKRQFK